MNRGGLHTYASIHLAPLPQMPISCKPPHFRLSTTGRHKESTRSGFASALRSRQLEERRYLLPDCIRTGHLLPSALPQSSVKFAESSGEESAATAQGQLQTRGAPIQLLLPQEKAGDVHRDYPRRA